MIDWGGIVARALLGDASLPSPLGGRLDVDRNHQGMSPARLLQPFLSLPEPAHPDTPQPAAGIFHLLFATYNVLSLAGASFEDATTAGLALVAGRPALLADSLGRAAVHAAALQEARTEAGFLRTGGFLRFSSGSAAGQLGVELWFKDGFRLVNPVGGAEATPVVFAKEAFSVLRADSRRLLMLLHSGSVQLCFASLHAPHRGTERAIVNQWWDDTTVLFDRLLRGRPLFVGGDFNATLGSIGSTAVDDFGAEEEDESGALLHAFILRCGLWVPATWAACHSGSSWTFLQKRNKAHTRIDFTCVPACWAEASCQSWVDPGINVGQAYIDHLASVVSIRFGMSFTARRAPPKLRLDTSAIRDPASQPKLSQIAAAAPVIPWGASADSHAAALVSYLQHSLQEAFPKPPSAPTKPYLQPDTWELHAQVSTLRRQCARLRSAVKRHFLAAALSAWRMHDGWLLWEALCTPWQCRAECIGLLRGAQLRVASSQLKLACKADRAAFISSLAEQVQSNTNDSHAALQRLLSVRQKKPFTPEVAGRGRQPVHWPSGHHRSMEAAFRGYGRRAGAHPRHTMRQCCPAPWHAVARTAAR